MSWCCCHTKTMTTKWNWINEKSSSSFASRIKNVSQILQLKKKYSCKCKCIQLAPKINRANVFFSRFILKKILICRQIKTQIPQVDPTFSCLQNFQFLTDEDDWPPKFESNNNNNSNNTTTPTPTPTQQQALSTVCRQDVLLSSVQFSAGLMHNRNLTAQHLALWETQKNRGWGESKWVSESVNQQFSKQESRRKHTALHRERDF